MSQALSFCHLLNGQARELAAVVDTAVCLSSSLSFGDCGVLVELPITSP